MDEFPKMLFRQPGIEALHGGLFSTLIVASAEEEADALARDWHLSTPAAVEAAAAAKAREAAQVDDAAPDDAPPTRAELEAKATELGIKFDGRMGDRKLGERIADALKAKG